MTKQQKQAAIKDIKSTLILKKDAEAVDRAKKQARLLTEDEELLSALMGDSILGCVGKASAPRGKAVPTTSPTAIELEIAKYVQFMISNPPTKDPLLV